MNFTSRKDWFAKRRPELKELFQRYIYGYLPPAPSHVGATIQRTDASAFHGKATLTELTLTFGPPEWPKLHLLLVVPNKRDEVHGAPVFAGVNISGNHSLVTDPAVRIPPGWMYDHHPGVINNRATEAGRAGRIDVWAIEQTIDRGYAVATFYSGDVEPDVIDTTAGLRAQWFKDHEPTLTDCGTIGAWAWSLQRVVDYFITRPDIDATRIAAVGHSRLGKTALLAAAFDERIAMVIPNQSGTGGMAPSRGKIGETVKQINDQFPHWFNGTYKTFNDNPDGLPIDQHDLVALVAPRPLLAATAVEDTWANPAGQFEVLKAADPIYRALGTDGLSAEQMPAPGQLVDSTLGYYIRPGVHSMTPGDWKIFLDFADKHMAGTTRQPMKNDTAMEGEVPAEPRHDHRHASPHQKPNESVILSEAKDLVSNPAGSTSKTASTIQQDASLRST